MRYIRYSGQVPNLEAIRKRGKELSAQLQRRSRTAKLLHKLGTAVFWVVFAAVFILLAALIRQILPEEDTVFGAIVSGLCALMLGVTALVISAITGAVAAGPLWGFWQRTEKAMLREELRESCAALRQFYQFNEPFLVTKCYRSSDKRFDRHDVCLFTVGDELRVTANLHYGFFDPKRDLGCYCLTRQEIRLSEAQHKDRPAVELQAEGVTFSLGVRAKAFIERHFFGRSEP